MLTWASVRLRPAHQLNGMEVAACRCRGSVDLDVRVRPGCEERPKELDPYVYRLRCTACDTETAWEMSISATTRAWNALALTQPTEVTP